MSKIILDDVTSLNATSVINSNFDKIESAMQGKVLFRDNPVGEPNSMTSNLDMNGKRIYNLPKPGTYGEPARLQDIVDLVAGDLVLPGAGVTSFNTREGAVVLTSGDVTDALGFTPPSNTNSVLIGNPTTTTQLTSDNTNKVATTAFVTSKIAELPAFPTHVTSVNGRSGVVTLVPTDVTDTLGYTPVNPASAALTGTPTATTALTADNSTRIATTEYVTNKVAASTAGVASFNTRTGAVTLSSGDVTGALGYTPPNSVNAALTGTPTAVTTATADNSTSIATTAYVKNNLAALATPVTSFNTRTGAVTLNSTDVSSALGYIPVNPNAAALLGTPTATTASTGDSTTRIATTALVDNKINAVVPTIVSRDSIKTALTGSADTVNWTWNSDVAGAVNAIGQNSIYLQRKGVYSGGTPESTLGLIYAESYTPTNNVVSEYGICSVVYSNSNSSGFWPQNVAMNGTIWKRGTAPTWGGNFVAYNQLGYLASGQGATIGIEVNCGGVGIETHEEDMVQTLGISADPQIKLRYSWTATTAFIGNTAIDAVPATGFVYVANAAGTTGDTQPTWPTTPGATVVDGSITWTCRVKEFRGGVAYRVGGSRTKTNVNGDTSWNYGVHCLSADTASFYSSAVGKYGAQFTGIYSEHGIDLSGMTLSKSGSFANTAIRLKGGHALGFSGDVDIRQVFNAGNGYLEFYNGSTRRGYIDMASGSDIKLNGNYVSASADNTFTGVNTFSSNVYCDSFLTASLGILLGSTRTIQWTSSGNYAPATRSFNGNYLRVLVDGAPIYLQAFN